MVTPLLLPGRPQGVAGVGRTDLSTPRTPLDADLSNFSSPPTRIIKQRNSVSAQSRPKQEEQATQDRPRDAFGSIFMTSKLSFWIHFSNFLSECRKCIISNKYNAKLVWGPSKFSHFSMDFSSHFYFFSRNHPKRYFKRSRVLI